MRILPDHEKLQYSGRIDWTDRKAPVFVFPCTFVRMRFTGEMLKIYVKNKKAAKGQPVQQSSCGQGCGSCGNTACGGKKL